MSDVLYDSSFAFGMPSQLSPGSFLSTSGDVAGQVGANSNRVLIVCATFNELMAAHGTVTVSWDGVDMGAAIVSANTPSGNGSAYLFKLVAPNTGAKTLSCAWTIATNPAIELTGVSLYNVDQTTPTQNTGSDTGTSADADSTVTGAATHMAVVGHVSINALSPTQDQGTTDVINNNMDDTHAVGHRLFTGATTVVGWNLGGSVAWLNVKVDVMPFVAAPLSVATIGEPVIVRSTF